MKWKLWETYLQESRKIQGGNKSWNLWPKITILILFKKFLVFSLFFSKIINFVPKLTIFVSKLTNFFWKLGNFVSKIPFFPTCNPSKIPQRVKPAPTPSLIWINLEEILNKSDWIPVFLIEEKMQKFRQRNTSRPQIHNK